MHNYASSTGKEYRHVLIDKQTLSNHLVGHASTPLVGYTLKFQFHLFDQGLKCRNVFTWYVKLAVIYNMFTRFAYNISGM